MGQKIIMVSAPPREDTYEEAIPVTQHEIMSMTESEETYGNSEQPEEPQ